MSYESRVFRILIASPSDVEEEREMVVRLIQEWNDLYSYSRRVTLLPLRWETHTAPEYFTRPQEVVNRAIVDDCDLLVGIFWTRIGTPTGVAQSGTLEEIDRVGNAKKPIMLYFSRVPADIEDIETKQINRLKEFKGKAYPNGLIETYKTRLEFQDKFRRQLQIKVAELQERASSGTPPLSLSFISADDGKSLGAVTTESVIRPIVSDLDALSMEKRPDVEKLVSRYIKGSTYVPMLLVISNSGAAGIRNLYMELEVTASVKDVEVTTSPVSPYSGRSWANTIFITKLWDLPDGPEIASPQVGEKVAAQVARYSVKDLQELESGWRVSVEWDALQAQRTRLIEPVLYASVASSTTFLLKAKIYADTFPQPLCLESRLDVSVTTRDVKLRELLPNWEALAQASVDVPGGMSSNVLQLESKKKIIVD